MAKRKFELPGIQDLSKEQETALACAGEGRHLIIGGPGTGKSVLSLLRGRRHHQEGDEYQFLVFNHLLNEASGQLFGVGLKKETWHKWFRRTFREIAGSPTPKLAENQSGFQDIDWNEVADLIDKLPLDLKPRQTFLVIDEGQDMPRQFYTSLVKLGFEYFFVVADQNQRITEANSSRADIEACLDIEMNEVIELKENFRNSYPVARLAREFDTGDPASPPPALPERSKNSDVPRLYFYDAERDFDIVVQGIIKRADREPHKLIGVIAPNNDVRERYFGALQSADDSNLDNPLPPIKTSYWNHYPEVAFDEGGILVINAQACKGLEFDTAILADIDEHYFSHDDPDTVKRLFYVMVARAKEQVFMFMKRGRGRAIKTILPTDDNVLRREELR